MDTPPEHVVSRYRVAGLTNLRGARRVADELSVIEGAVDIDVNLASGDVRIASTCHLADDEVEAAVEEAGYGLVTG